MQRRIIIAYKIWKHLRLTLMAQVSNVYCKGIFYLNGIGANKIKCLGFPYVHVSLKAKCIIGRNFKMNNGARYSDSGLNGKCRIEVRETAVLSCGNNVGMSDVTITCHEKITIGNNVLLGVGSQLRDTDNHSLNPIDRLNGLDWKNKRTAPIIIGDNVFIGAYSIILKGVVIGNNSIIGAGSVLTKSVGENEVWAGNPARFIRKIKV